MGFVHVLAGLTGTLYKTYFYFGMVLQDADEFTCSVAAATDYSNFDHVLWGLRLKPKTLFLVYRMEDLRLVAQNLRKPFHVFPAEAFVHFSVVAKGGVHQIVW